MFPQPVSQLIWFCGTVYSWERLYLVMLLLVFVQNISYLMSHPRGD